jgi:hypothetical protein
MESLIDVRILHDIDAGQQGSYRAGEVVTMTRRQAEELAALRTSPFGGGSKEINHRYSESPVVEVCKDPESGRSEK